MRRGQMGISLSLIAVAAFAAVLLEWTIPLFLIIGYAFAIEKDTWLSQQVVQAGILYGAYKLAGLVVSRWIFGGLGEMFRAVKAYGAADAMFVVGDVFSTIFYIAMIALSIWALIRLCQEKDAAIPFVAKKAKEYVPGATL